MSVFALIEKLVSFLLSGLFAFVLSLNADVVADAFSSPVTRPTDLVFKGQIHSQSAVTVFILLQGSAAD